MTPRRVFSSILRYIHKTKATSLSLISSLTHCKFALEEQDLMTAFFLQFTEEKLGQAEKTELDAHFENLLARADCTKNWTEKILRQTEVLLQPNPSKSSFS